MANKAVRGAQFDFTPTDRVLIQAKQSIKKRLDDIVNAIDDEALQQGLIEAKGEYSNLIKRSQLIGGKVGVTPKNIASKLQRSLIINNETDFDAFRELLPTEQFDEAIAAILNQTALKGKSFLARPFSAAAEFAAEKIGQTGAFIAGEAVPFEIGGVTQAALTTRRGLGQIPGAIGGLGARTVQRPAVQRQIAIEGGLNQ